MHRFYRSFVVALSFPYVSSFGGLGIIPIPHEILLPVEAVVPPFVQSTTIASSETLAVSSSPSLSLATSLATDLLEKYTTSLTANPLAIKMTTGAVLAVAGDAIAQSREPDTEYDKRRAASFMTFDMSYRALQHSLFPLIVQNCHGQFMLAAMSVVPPLAKLAEATPEATSYLGAIEQTLASQLGIVPFMYYPVFFALTGFVQGLTVEGTQDRAKDNFIPLMKRNLLFWIPVQFVQFGFIEESLQIPFLSLCGLGWTFILSAMAGSTKKYGNEDYCVTNEEPSYVAPADLFPAESSEDIAALVSDSMLMSNDQDEEGNPNNNDSKAKEKVKEDLVLK